MTALGQPRDPTSGLEPDDSERSLGRERFRGHNFTIGNNHRQKRNQNLTMAGRQYPAFWLPNIY